MLHRTAWIVALALALTAGSAFADKKDKKDGKAKDQSSNATRERSDDKLTNEEIVDIRKAVAAALDDMLTRDGVNKAVNHLCKDSQERCKSLDDSSGGNYDEKIDRFNQLFREKYHQKFNPAEVHGLLAEGRIRGNFKRAFLTLENGWGNKTIEVKLVKPGGEGPWRINLPEDDKGRNMKLRMKNRLHGLNQTHGSWPDDVREGYRLVAGRMLRAVGDLEDDEK